MFAGDRAAGMVGSIAELFPNAAYQHCAAYFYRNVLARVSKTKCPRVIATLNAVHAMESRVSSNSTALEAAAELDGMRLGKVARAVRDG